VSSIAFTIITALHGPLGHALISGKYIYNLQMTNNYARVIVPATTLSTVPINAQVSASAEFNLLYVACTKWSHGWKGIMLSEEINRTDSYSCELNLLYM